VQTSTHRVAPSSSLRATVALILLIIGGINWAFVGLFGVDLVATLLGSMSPASRLVYILVGAAALVAIASFKRMTRPRPD